MKIIVTGSTGFVGKNLLTHITNSNMGNVVPLSFRGSLPSSLDGDVLVHLAGKAHDLANTSSPQEYFDVNYEKTKQLFDLFLISNIRDFVYFSSVKAVADTVDGVLEEDVDAAYGTPYGESKWLAEQYLISKELPEGKRLFILRPCMIHGPGNKGNLNLLYKVVKKGIPYPLGAFENRRSFLSIDNLLFALERIIRDPSVSGGVYNIADDESLSTNELIKVIADASGSRGSVWNLSKGLISGVARIGDKLHLPLNSERLKKLTESYVVSNEKIKKALKVEQFPVSSREGLMRTILSINGNG